MPERKKFIIIEHAPERSEGIPELIEKYTGVKPPIIRTYLGEPLPKPKEIDAVISGGGPMGVYEITNPKYEFLLKEADFIGEMIARNKAVLGICLGHQLLAHVLGEKVVVSEHNKEIGWSKITLTTNASQDELFKGVPNEFMSFQYHKDHVPQLPKGTTLLASTLICTNQAFRLDGKKVWGVQFHPEITPEKAKKILESRKTLLEEQGVDVVLAIDRGFKANHSPRNLIFYNFTQAIK